MVLEVGAEVIPLQLNALRTAIQHIMAQPKRALLTHPTPARQERASPALTHADPAARQVRNSPSLTHADPAARQERASPRAHPRRPRHAKSALPALPPNSGAPRRTVSQRHLPSLLRVPCPPSC